MPVYADFPVTILRLPGIYGQGDREQSTVGVLFHQLARDRSVVVYGDGKNMRDYIFAPDIAHVIEHFLCFPSSETFNVATGQSVSILDVIHILADAMNITPKITFENMNSMVHQHCLYNISRLKHRIPSVRFTNIQVGVSKYVQEQVCLRSGG